MSRLKRDNPGGLSGLVLDLRNNPGGVLEAGVAVADALPRMTGVIVTADGRTPDARFRMDATPGDLIDGAPLVVLVNGGSASASEIVAGALKDHGRALLIGHKTYGKGSVQTVMPLAHGGAVKLTTSRYFTPSGALDPGQGHRAGHRRGRPGSAARRARSPATPRRSRTRRRRAPGPGHAQARRTALAHTWRPGTARGYRPSPRARAAAAAAARTVRAATRILAVMLAWLIDLVLHLDRHLVELLARYDLWIYPILFAVIFAETGLVVTPFLPGDSLLFAVGRAGGGGYQRHPERAAAVVLLGVAAVLGNTANYAIGRAIGPPAFSGRYRLLKVEYLRRTEAFFVATAAWRSCCRASCRSSAPARRSWPASAACRTRASSPTTCSAASLWVMLFIWGGYLFGNIPFVKQNFGVVTLSIVVVSLVPVAVMRCGGGAPAGNGSA